MRYDISDPRDPGVFLPKVWTARNIAVKLSQTSNTPAAEIAGRLVNLDHPRR